MDWVGFALPVGIPSFMGFIMFCIYVNFVISFHVMKFLLEKSFFEK
jgi:hypothetical protein